MEFDAVARREVAALKLPLSPYGLRGQYACGGEQDREDDTVLFHNDQLLFVSWLWVRVSHLISNTMMSPNARLKLQTVSANNTWSDSLLTYLADCRLSASSRS